MLEFKVRKFQIKYIMLTDLGSAMHSFRDDVSEEFKQAYMEAFRREIPSAMITFLGDEDQCQALTFNESSPLVNMLFKVFSLNPAINTWDEFTDIALDEEIKAVVVSGEVENSVPLNDYIIALYSGTDYNFVSEHHSYVNPGPVKRPVASVGTGRDMLEVLTTDLKYKEEDVLNLIESAIMDEEKDKKLKR